MNERNSYPSGHFLSNHKHNHAQLISYTYTVRMLLAKLHTYANMILDYTHSKAVPEAV